MPVRPAELAIPDDAPSRAVADSRYQAIVHAAGELFAERGFDNTSLQDISAAVGVLRGSLYHYISSKEELLYAVIQHGHEGLLENIRMCKELRAGPAETLAAFTIGHITLNVHPDRYQRGIVFLRDSTRLSEDKRQAVIRDRDAYTEYLLQIIRKGQRDKVFCPDLDVRLTAHAILGVLNSFHRWYRPTGKSSPQDIARQFSAFILAAVSCTPQTHTPGHRTALIDTVTAQLPPPNTDITKTQPPAEEAQPTPERPERGKLYDRIVHAAGELFAERGFDNTSLQDISAAVGVLRGSLYHYISSKEELLYAVIQHGHEGLLENIRMCKELRAGPAETLAAFTIGHITLNVHPDRYQRGIVFLRDSTRLSEDKRQAVIRDRDAYTEYLLQIIRKGQRDKVFCPDLDVRLTAHAILGVLNSFHRWYRPTGKSSPQDIARQFSAFILAAVSCTPQTHTPGHRTALIDTVTAQLPPPNTDITKTQPPAEEAQPTPERPERGKLYDRIVHAAGELFAERGFDNTSLQDISAAVGVLRGSLYHYISSKEELLYAVIQHGHEGLLENIRMCKELRAGPAETLAAFTIGHITLNVHPDRYQRGIVFLRDSTRLSEDKRQAVIRDRDAYTEYLLQIIRKGQRDKVFCPDLDVRLTAHAILGVLNSFHRWYRPTGKSSPQDIARQFSAFILAAVSCTPQTHTPGHRTALIDTVTAQLPPPNTDITKTQPPTP